ncbi:MAG: hypothetical protein WBE58_02055, partial [Verrucomicrobiales bacterium]
MNAARLFAVLLPVAGLPAALLRSAEPYDPGRFEREILVPSSRDALQFEILPNGDLLFAEFW